MSVGVGVSASVWVCIRCLQTPLKCRQLADCAGALSAPNHGPCPARPSAGFNPLQAYGAGSLMSRVCAALGRLMTACHTLYGFSRLTSSMLK